jgi:hypothetical protein
MRMAQQPTFMFCVGATKAGTSWLHEQLSAHPECHFRTIKELHYFTMTKPEHFKAAVARNAAEMAAVAALPVTPRRMQRIADMQAWQQVLAKGKIDPDAYRGFLTDGASDARLVGDVTPAYALMPEDRMRALSGVAADVRVVYLIRDPLARLWSHVRMIASRSGVADFAAAATAQLERILRGDLAGEGQGIVARGDYSGIIAKLRRAFDPTRLLVQFTEDVMTSAGAARLAGFLGLTGLVTNPEVPVHEGKPLSFPGHLRDETLHWLRPQYKAVAAQVGQVPAAWRMNMEKGFA